MSDILIKGLDGVVVAQSSKSKVYGEIGKLIYGGYAIEDLAENVTFEEVIHLLWYGELPNQAQLAALKSELADLRAVPDGVLAVLRDLPLDAHPMSVLRTLVSALGCLDNADAEAAARDEAARWRCAKRLVARIPTLIAAHERHRRGQPMVAPRADLAHAANFLHMLHGTPPGPRAERALDAYLVLLADHGFNASTFSARVTVSTESDPYSAITTAIGTLKGPLHGGANERVMAMLEQIGDPSRAKAFVDETLSGKGRIPGIGHRVYKTLDPRAGVLRRLSEELVAEVGDSPERRYHEIATNVADAAAAWFETNRPDLRLHPNVDFYSAIALRVAGVPTDQFTPMFAMSRVAGYTAHILEQYADNRLIRPRGEYVGPLDRVVAPIEER